MRCVAFSEGSATATSTANNHGIALRKELHEARVICAGTLRNAVGVAG